MNKLISIVTLLLIFVFFNTVKLFAFSSSLEYAPYALIVDSKTGSVIYEKNSHQKIYPASMTKIMSAFIVFDALKNNTINITDKVKVSDNAYQKGGHHTGSSTMFLRAGESVDVDSLLRGSLSISGNDAVIALAEYTAGSEQQFINAMNEKAASLGMENTNYITTDGWYDKDHYTTPYDTVLLMNALLETHMEFYKEYFAIKEYSHGGVKQRNRNPLLFVEDYLPENIKVDGMKTGSTKESKFSIAFSAFDAETDFRILGVFSGIPTVSQRRNASLSAVQLAFRRYESNNVYAKNTTVTKIPLIGLKKSSIVINAEKDINYITNKENDKNINITITQPNFISNGIKKGDVLAVLKIENSTDESLSREITFVSYEDISKQSKVIEIAFAPYYAIKKLIS